MKKALLVKSALMLSATIVAIPVQAQTSETGEQDPAAATDRDNSTLGGIIIVSARRVDENLQTTPVAVTALQTEQLEIAQVVSQVDLQRVSPSLSIRKGAPSSSGFTYVAIRGQANLNPGVANDPAVGIYSDGVYISRPSQGITDLDDIKRVEVLRGPQGTLFGRNTIGGAINILSNDPTEDLEANVRGEYGNFDTWMLGGMINLPIAGDEFGIRAVYKHSQHDGYFRNAFLNRDESDSESDFARIKMRFAPEGSAFSAVLSADYNKITDSGQPVRLAGINPALIGPGFTAVFRGALAPLFTGLRAGGVPVNVNGIDLSTINAQFQPFILNLNNNINGFSRGFAADSVPNGGRAPYNDLKAYGGSLTMMVDLDTIMFKSISAYRYSNNNGLIDLDASPIDLIATRSGYTSKQISQEFQVSGNIGDSIEYIGGIYASSETGSEFSEFQTFGFLNGYVESVIAQQIAGLPFPPGFASSLLPAPATPLNDARVKNETFGAFGQVYVNLTDRLRLTAGLRWTFDNRQVILSNLAQTGLAPGTPLPPQASPVTGFNCVNAGVTNAGQAATCRLIRQQEFDYPAYTIGLDYEASDDLFLYAKHSRAAKAGGFNLRQGSETTPAFSPETTRDVEFGFKYTDPGRLFRVNGAVFYAWTTDVQRNVGAVINGLSTQFFQNSGETQIKGLELEAFVNPVTGLELTGNFSYLDGKYKNGSYIDLVNVPGVGVVPVDRSGEPLQQTPEFQYSVGATYTIPIGTSELSLHADYAWIDDQRTNPVTPVPGASAAVQAQFATSNQLDVTPSYGLLNGRIGFKLENGFELYAFARNLTDERYIVNTFSSLYTSLGFSNAFLGDPRTFGIGARFSFGGR